MNAILERMLNAAITLPAPASCSVRLDENGVCWVVDAATGESLLACHEDLIPDLIDMGRMFGKELPQMCIDPEVTKQRPKYRDAIRMMTLALAPQGAPNKLGAPHYLYEAMK